MDRAFAVALYDCLIWQGSCNVWIAFFCLNSIAFGKTFRRDTTEFPGGHHVAPHGCHGICFVTKRSSESMLWATQVHLKK